MSWFDPWEEIEAVALDDQPVASALTRASAPTARILSAALDGTRPSVEDAERLFAPQPRADLVAMARAADHLRATTCGDDVTYVVNRNINFTNVCFVNCHFCAFKRHRSDADAYTHGMDGLLAKVDEAVARGATEVCMQGGINPEMPPFQYRDMLRAIKGAYPDLHVHAFSPMEIMYGVRRTGLSTEAFIAMLRDEGLGSIPGTAAEILDDEVREILSHKKVDVATWVEIITTAHRLGVPTTSTVMYGHVESPAHLAHHLDLLRRIQAETGGFTEFVPLGFIWDNTRLHRDGIVGPQRKGLRDLQIYAASRLVLHGSIGNLQTSWVKLGHRLAQLSLRVGCNDFGGTLMEESISREAGADSGEYTSPEEIQALVRAVGRRPVERTTLYRRVHGDGCTAGDGARRRSGRGPLPAGPHPTH